MPDIDIHMEDGLEKRAAGEPHGSRLPRRNLIDRLLHRFSFPTSKVSIWVYGAPAGYEPIFFTVEEWRVGLRRGCRLKYVWFHQDDAERVSWGDLSRGELRDYLYRLEDPRVLAILERRGIVTRIGPLREVHPDKLSLSDLYPGAAN